MRRVFVHVMHMEAEAVLLGFLYQNWHRVGLILYDRIKASKAVPML